MRYIISHKNNGTCADGLVSAMILRLLYPEAKTLFLQYGTPELDNLPAEPGMIFCDISPPISRAAEFLNVGAIVLDHHKTAEPVASLFAEHGQGRFADEKRDPGVSGARLALEHLNQEDRHFLDRLGCREVVTRFAHTVGIWDTWQTTDLHWSASCDLTAALRGWPQEKWLAASPGEWDRMAELGPVLESRHLADVRQSIADGVRCTVTFWEKSKEDRELRLVLFQGNSPVTSTAAEVLGHSADLVVGFGHFWQNDRPMVKYSLRSHSGFDVSAFAKLRGGGGHTASAAYAAVAKKDPYTQFIGEFPRLSSVFGAAK